MDRHVIIDTVDAIEIADALRWLCDWFASDPTLGVSMRRFSLGMFTLDEISAELDEFASTLGHQS